MTTEGLHPVPEATNDDWCQNECDEWPEAISLVTRLVTEPEDDGVDHQCSDRVTVGKALDLLEHESLRSLGLCPPGLQKGLSKSGKACHLTNLIGRVA